MAERNANHPLESDQAMIIAGIGCKRNTSQEAIEQVVTDALARAHKDRTQLEALATHESKVGEPGIIGLSRAWQIRIESVSTSAMEHVTHLVKTKSMRSLTEKGVPSVAEAAALAAAGANARLLCERVTSQTATCALAEGDRSAGS